MSIKRIRGRSVAIFLTVAIALIFVGVVLALTGVVGHLPREATPQEIDTFLLENLATGPAEPADLVRGRSFTMEVLGSMRLVRDVMAPITILIVLIALLLIHSSLTISIPQRKREFNTASLVGASNTFLASTFLLELSMLGLCGGLAAGLLVGAAFEPMARIFGEQVPYLRWVVGMQLSEVIALGMRLAVIGAAIGTASGILVLRKLLRRP